MELHAGKEAVEVSSRYEEVGWEEVEIEEREWRRRRDKRGKASGNCKRRKM